MQSFKRYEVAGNGTFYHRELREKVDSRGAVGPHPGVPATQWGSPESYGQHPTGMPLPTRDGDGGGAWGEHQRLHKINGFLTGRGAKIQNLSTKNRYNTTRCRIRISHQSK